MKNLFPADCIYQKRWNEFVTSPGYGILNQPKRTGLFPQSKPAGFQIRYRQVQQVARSLYSIDYPLHIMKKTLFILTAMTAATVAAEASTVLISFGINSGQWHCHCGRNLPRGSRTKSKQGFHREFKFLHFRSTGNY